MTTIISLAARDFIVVGCDSLATTIRDLVIPHKIDNQFFDDAGSLKVDVKGKPILTHSSQIWGMCESMPVDQLPSVTKLYDLTPFKACLLFAGASRIGDLTIKNVVEAFLNEKEVKAAKKTYTMKWLSEKLRDFTMSIYAGEFTEDWRKPSLEIILSGYSARYYHPELWRLTFSYNRKTNIFECAIDNAVPRKEYNVIFGGQYDVIQRVVNGIDFASFLTLRSRTMKLLDQYHDKLMEKVKEINASISIPKPDLKKEADEMFADDRGGVTSMYSDVGSLSEQAGIDLVRFLIDVMIKAQEFSPSIPTVGGKIHVAMLSKSTKFRWISKESFKFENEDIPKFQNA